MLRVLHIDSGRSWRGGQKHLQLLLEQLGTQQVESHLLIPQGCAHRDQFAGVYHLFERPFGAALSQLKLARELSRYCHDQRIDLLHAHSSKAHSLAMLINFFATPKLPLVVHRHVIFPPARLLISRFKYGPRVVSQFIAVSKAVEKTLLDANIAPEHITTIKAGIRGSSCDRTDKQLAKHRLCAATQLNPHQHLIGFCAALTAEKGCFDLLKAIVLLRKTSGESPQVVIAGEGPLRAKLEDEIAHHKLHDHVKVLGFISDTAGFFAAIDTLVFPSTSEGLGLTLLEAAYGLCAVIATRVGGISEVILHQKTGILVAPSAPREIVQGLRTLMENPLLCRKYALNLRAHVRKHFSCDLLGEACSRVYRRVLSSAPYALSDLSAGLPEDHL